MPPDDDLEELRETIARALDPSLWNEWGFDKTFNVIMRERNRQKADAVLASLGLEPDGPIVIVRKTERKPGGVAPLRPNGMHPRSRYSPRKPAGGSARSAPCSTRWNR